jgi:4-hydroxybenzoate polyprenyltransferase
LFIALGVFGFVPGVTTQYDQMQFAGADSQALLFGVFQVSVLHNLLHLLYGIAGIWAAGNGVRARSYLVGGGTLYLLIWLYAYLIDSESPAALVALSDADNWLHLFLGVGMINLGLLMTRPPADKPITG